MRVVADEVASELVQLRTAAEALSLTLEEALKQKTDELRVRQHIRKIPNAFITERLHADFLTHVLGRRPSAEEVESVLSHTRRLTVRRCEVDFEVLISQQCYRCALCGASLKGSRSAEVDHIKPLSLGGPNDISNYQILCMACNRDKGQLLGWVMGAPFFYRFSRKGQGAANMSRKVRYCALVRAGSACQESGCAETSRTSPLHVDLVIPRNAGGRPIFDNVAVRCERHYYALRDERWVRAIENVQSGLSRPSAASRRSMPAFDFLAEMRVGRRPE